MTIDEMIKELEAARADLGGDAPVLASSAYRGERGDIEWGFQPPDVLVDAEKQRVLITT
jgi:hypothetical protein